ncbi:protein regulator of cytokinesis 1 [Drosophila eugracilis]|uniref:protein regulator of cytokinesis 1 n=1 Tax=Drosophila eugracilis TaxID=29029 RepID=UPI0007E5C166|nr:protein regulator of cytokinesis 1 [Drosophila eugracilis]
MILTEHKTKILEMTGDHVDELYAMWMRMFEPKTCEDCLIRLNEHAHNFYMDLIQESREKEECFIRDISSLHAEATNLSRLLHKSVDIGERPEDMPLVVWQLKMDNSIVHLREELASRRSEISELLLQQGRLCQQLGELPMPLLMDPLPLPEQMDTFRDHLQKLRDKRERYLNEMDEMRQDINKNMKLLELFAQTDNVKRLLSPESRLLSPKSYEMLRLMQVEYAEQVRELCQKIDTMRERIELIWQRLKVTDEFAMRRVREATSYNQRTFDILREELERCEEMRIQNLPSFIEQLRIDIKVWWDLTLKSPQERRRFTSYYCGDQTEDVLEAHEIHLEHLKAFYNKNRKIFELYANRAELWARMEALEAKANDPNRFNNRGGQLLKEEKERKAITARLPKIDNQITEVVKAYMSQTDSPFLVNGEDILEIMSADWERRRLSKKQPSAQKKDTNNTNIKMKPPPAPLTPSTQKGNRGINGSSLKKTPSKSNPAITAKSTGNLQKRRHPNHSGNSPQPAAAAKRNLITSLECNNPRAGLGANIQKILKSPQKKVRVLEYSVRRGKASGRSSTGHRNPQRKRPIPQVYVQPPSGEENENESTDDDGGDLEVL